MRQSVILFQECRPFKSHKSLHSFANRYNSYDQEFKRINRALY